MILQAHPTGNANVRHAALALAQAGLLGEFHTCLAPAPDAVWLRLLPAALRRQALRRAIPSELVGRTRVRPARELGRLVFSALGWTRWLRPEAGPCCIDTVYRDLDEAAARRLRSHRPRFTAVYAYEDGADALFATARELGIPTIYDLPIGYWRVARRLLAEEAELSPEWAGTLGGLRDSEAKLARKDRELAQADAVFVASSFTRATLAEAPVPPRKIIVIPYGAPLPPPDLEPARRAPGEPLRVLFVGSLGQRKGLRYLLEAIGSLGATCTLTLIGSVPAAPCAPLAAALRRHRHIASLPHAEILAEMRRHHVFVFPSLFEGFGLVLLEAMASGLPLIATPHTAAPDLITEGREGHIVPIRDSMAIATRLTEMAANEEHRHAMACAALDLARELTWEKYRSTLAREIVRLIKPDSL
jgi:glycosyltransferase involved in cell wall biosynthesis